MPVSTERFIECLATTGIVSRAEAESLVGPLSPAERAADADGFARELVRQGKLTRYQAAAIYQEKADGLLLGNYLILDRLGAGGMGQVFRARHCRMDRVVALKMLSKRALDSPEALARFLREVKTAARLVHPNIVTAYDADEVGGLHFLVMECVDGTDLAALVKSQGPLPIGQAIDCVSQAAVGLEHAHRQGIVHRDIKPPNLLLDSSGVLKILDMGLARLGDALAEPAAGSAAAPDVAPDLTSSGSIMGTIDYMAPEQAMDSRQADARSDIYSLGCTLHYLLTARAPFSADTIMQRLRAHRQAAIPSLAALRPDVPSGVQAVFARMLAKQPAERFQSMREVIEALKSSQAPAAPIAVPRAVVATPVPVAPVPIAAVPLASQSSELEAMESIALPGDWRKRRRRKSHAPLVAVMSVLLFGAVGVGLWLMNQQDDATVALHSTSTTLDHKAVESPVGKTATSAAAPPTLPPSTPPAAADNEPPEKPVAMPVPPKPEVVVITPSPAKANKASKKSGKKHPPPAVAKKSDTGPPPDMRHEVPPAAALDKARQLVEEVYKADFALAKAPEAKPALAKKLLRDVEKTQDDWAARYVMLHEATDLAADAGDVTLARQTLDTLAVQFVVDSMAEYSAVLLRMSAKPHSLAVETRLLEAATAQVDAALAAAKFDAAQTAAVAAEDAARRTKDTSLLKQMVDLNKSVKTAHQQWDVQQAALAVLEHSPNDQAANLLVGHYQAFVQGNWPQGFAHLAKGGSGILPELAAKSLAPALQPTALAELGDAWWKASESAKSKERAELRAAAAYWYHQALPGLTGLQRENVLNHLSEASDRTAVKGAIVVFTFEPNCFVTSGKSRQLLDLSGQGNHAEVHKAVSVPGKVGSGLSFGVGNTYVECAQSDSLNSLTALSICAWIKPRSWKDSPVDYIVSKDDWADGGEHGFVLRGGGKGDINFAFGNGGWRDTFSKRHLELDVWHHVASVYDGRRVTIFLDGVPDATKDTPFTISPSTYPLRIGRGGFTPDRHFDGLIDELAIFNRPLSDIEVRSLYRHGLQGKPLAK